MRADLDGGPDILFSAGPARFSAGVIGLMIVDLAFGRHLLLFSSHSVVYCLLPTEHWTLVAGVARCSIDNQQSSIQRAAVGVAGYLVYRKPAVKSFFGASDAYAASTGPGRFSLKGDSN